MTELIRPNPGLEFDWLAVDAYDHIGLFSTGGQGLVPKAVVDNLAAVQTAVEHINSLPVVGECLEAPEDGDFSFWIEPARRGFYGYDWGPVPVGPYARLTVPSRPVLLSDL